MLFVNLVAVPVSLSLTVDDGTVRGQDKDSLAEMGLRQVAMVYVGEDGRRRDDHIPDVDWEYAEYEVQDEYHKSNARCILGIAHDRFHIVQKTSKSPALHWPNTVTPRQHTNPSHAPPSPSLSLSRDVRHDSSHRNHHKHGRRGMTPITGSVLPHFTYVFNIRSTMHTVRRTDRWLDARILQRQKSHKLKLHQMDDDPCFVRVPLEPVKSGQNLDDYETVQSAHGATMPPMVPSPISMFENC